MAKWLIVLKTILLLGLCTNVAYMLNPGEGTGVADKLDYWACLWLYMCSDVVLHFLAGKNNISAPILKHLGKVTIVLSMVNMVGPSALPLFPGIPAPKQVWLLLGKTCISAAILTVLLLTYRFPFGQTTRPGQPPGKGPLGTLL